MLYTQYTCEMRWQLHMNYNFICINIKTMNGASMTQCSPKHWTTSIGNTIQAQEPHQELVTIFIIQHTWLKHFYLQTCLHYSDVLWTSDVEICNFSDSGIKKKILVFFRLLTIHFHRCTYARKRIQKLNSYSFQ